MNPSPSPSAIAQSRAIASGIRRLYLSAGLDIQDASRLSGIPVRRLRRCGRTYKATLTVDETAALALGLKMNASQLIEATCRPGPGS